MTRVITAVLAGSLLVSGQHTSPQVFRSIADLVPVYVTVMGRDGRALSGLQQSDFTLLDSGKPRPIAFFSAARHPFAVAIVLDGTFSMWLGAGFQKQMAAARELAEALDADDQVALGSLTRPVAELSDNKVNVSRLLRQSVPSVTFGARGFEGTESRPGLAWALSSLAVYDGRRIVVMFTDGQGRSRSDKIDDFLFSYQDPVQLAGELIKDADRVDASIHVIAFDDSMVSEEFLTTFASSGGGASLIARDANLTAVAKDFVDELHHEYLIGFVPAQFDGKSHKIQVKVNKPGVRVRARASYFAPKR
jgi:VWFA-related protein